MPESDVVAASPAEEVWLDLAAESVAITKRRHVEIVRVTALTQTRDVQVDEALVQEGVVVERVPVGRYVDAVSAVRQDGETTILPVVEEEVVVTRRLFLREEVHLHRTRTTTRHTETISLREQVASVSRVPAEPIPPGTVADITRADTALPPTLRRNTMSQETIVAVYDTPAAADAAVADLRAANVPESAISRHNGPAGTAGTLSATSTTTTPVHEKGFWASLFGGDEAVHDHDATVYDRSMQGGSSVVVVKGTPEHDVESVMAILERHAPIDIDERAASYGLATGQTGATGAMATGAMATGATRTGTMATGTMATGAADEAGRMQLSEEQIAVGKRVINRGGTRIRRYVVETPVEENVTLHSEKVTLERHPVTDGRPVTDGSFSERVIEMTETAEEAVVSKTARVVEEVGLRKDVADRVETVRDTVRKEEIEVVSVPGGTSTTGTTTPMTPMSGTGTTPKV